MTLTKRPCPVNHTLINGVGLRYFVLTMVNPITSSIITSELKSQKEFNSELLNAKTFLDKNRFAKVQLKSQIS